jgi:hypothetical protein
VPMSSRVLRSISFLLQERTRFEDSATSHGDLAFALMKNNFAAE